jgi:hypothetical protein
MQYQVLVTRDQKIFFRLYDIYGICIKRDIYVIVTIYLEIIYCRIYSNTYSISGCQTLCSMVCVGFMETRTTIIINPLF